MVVALLKNREERVMDVLSIFFDVWDRILMTGSLKEDDWIRETTLKVQQ